MNETEYHNLSIKLKSADKFKLSISKIDEILQHLNGVTTKCTEIVFQYYGRKLPHGWGFDTENEWGYVNEKITPETLCINENDFYEWFTKPIVLHLRDLREKLEKDFADLN